MPSTFTLFCFITPATTRAFTCHTVLNKQSVSLPRWRPGMNIWLVLVRRSGHMRVTTARRFGRSVIPREDVPHGVSA